MVVACAPFRAVAEAGSAAAPFCEGREEKSWKEAGTGGRVCEEWTSTGSQPPGACFIFADSMPRKRGMEGPVRSTSRMPTEWPARHSERASCVVTDDLPTPPLPDKIWAVGS